MGKAHRYQRSSSGTQFGSFQRKKSFTSRNLSTSFNQQQELGSFDARPNTRYGFGLQGFPHRPPFPPYHHHHAHDAQHPPPPPPPHPPAPTWGWHARHGGPTGSSGSGIPLRSPNTTPPAMPYDFPPPQPLYPHVPYAADRGSDGPFRRPVDHGCQEFQNRLFLDEYRFPGSHQTYQPPHLEGGIQAPLAHPWEGENACELEGPPVVQSIQLRGDAPEFVPGWKPALGEESVSKHKEPCWLIVSSS
ncbi:hypothetical protein BDW72DRAFT_181169 [Aspergillus terricola var. indicus]